MNEPDAVPLVTSSGRRSNKPSLLPWTATATMPQADVAADFGRYVSPGLLKLFRRLGFDRVRIARARGVCLVDEHGRELLDFCGAFGAVGLGHNHPRLAAARREYDARERPELTVGLIPAEATVLAKNLATVLPGDLSITYLCSTGSEAVEAALKLVQKAAGTPAGRLLHAEGAMHGKTAGALSVTGNARVREPFRLVPHGHAFRFGDLDSLDAALTQRGVGGGRATAVIVEPIQSGAGVVVPPSGYLAGVRRLCDRHGAFLIVDEVQTGMGRTGRLCAFEHDGIVPDVVTLSKSLGGGKVAIAACVARRGLFRAAYGSMRDATLHNATFNGIGSAAAVATEALHVLYDEELIARAGDLGAELLERLERLASAHPDVVADVRGRGLLIGIELRAVHEVLPLQTLAARSRWVESLGDGALSALVASTLLHRYGILVGLTDFDRNVLRLTPPLNIDRQHVERFVCALSDLLSGGVLSLLGGALGRTLGLDAP
jgi:ornithine--oxo-acid transaminase